MGIKSIVSIVCAILVFVSTIPAQAQSSVVIAEGLDLESRDLYFDEGYIYFGEFNGGDGRLVRVPEIGGPVEVLATGISFYLNGNRKGVKHIDFTPNHMYFSYGGYDHTLIVELSRDDLSRRTLVDTTSGAQFAGKFDDFIYYMTNWRNFNQVNIAPGSSTTRIGSENLWIRTSRVDGASLYFVNYWNKSLYRFDSSTGSPPYPIINNDSSDEEGWTLVGPEHAYIGIRGSITQVSKNGGPVTTITLQNSTDFVRGVDETYFYYTTNLTEQLWRVPIIGGTAELLDADARIDGRVFSRNGYIYWQDFRQGNDSYTLYRLDDSIAPIAVAGADQTIHVGTLVNLDGSGSSDPDNAYPLSYQWGFADKPLESLAVFSDATVVNPTFIADVEGDYTASLVVSDTQNLSSIPDDVVVSTYNTAPVADAGTDAVINLIGTTVLLDGTQSFDPDGDFFSYLWTIQSKPLGSLAVLDDSAVVGPSYIADVNGDYIISLVVTDIFGAISVPATVTVSFNNVKPIADAGVNQSVVAGDTVFLDGSNSSDANLDTITHSWSLVTIPSGSTTTISNSIGVQTNFVADVPGTYIVSLIVDDGLVTSDASNITITAISVETAATVAVSDTIDVINSIPDLNVLKNDSMQNTLTNKLNSVLELIDQGDFQTALDKLNNDLLKKTNGCAESSDPSKPDKNDWIKDCPTQNEVYPLILQTINFLEEL